MTNTSVSAGRTVKVFTAAADPLDDLLLDHDDIEALLRDLVTTPRSTFSLRGNQLTVGAVRRLCGFATADHFVTTLDLGMCFIGDGGALPLCRSIALSRAKTLKRLDLSLCGLTSEGVCDCLSLLRARPAHLSVKQLVLRYNHRMSADVVAEAIKSIPSLELLDVSYCAMGKTSSRSAIRRLEVVLSQQSFCCRILLVGNEFSASDRLALSEAAMRNRGIKKMGGVVFDAETALHPHTPTDNATSLLFPALSGLIETPPIPVEQAVVTDPREKSNCRQVVGRPRERPVLEAVLTEIALIETKPLEVARNDKLSRSSSKERRASINKLDCAAPPYQRYRSRSFSRSSAGVGTTLYDPAQTMTVVVPAPAASQSTRRAGLRLFPDTGQAPSLLNHRDPCAPVSANTEEPSTARSVARSDNVSTTSTARTHNISRSVFSESRRTMSAQRLQMNSVANKSRTNASLMGKEIGDSPQKRGIGDPVAVHPIQKGTAVRMLLDRCVVSDAQCANVLELDDVASLGPGLSAETEHPLPQDLLLANGIPSKLETMPLLSDGRVRGVAKVLFVLLYGSAGRFLERELVKSLVDIPSSVKAEGVESAARYRAARAVENTLARKKIELWKAVNIRQPSHANPVRSRSAAAPSRYMQNAAEWTERAQRGLTSSTRRTDATTKATR